MQSPLMEEVLLEFRNLNFAEEDGTGTRNDSESKDILGTAHTSPHRKARGGGGESNGENALHRCLSRLYIIILPGTQSATKKMTKKQFSDKLLRTARL